MNAATRARPTLIRVEPPAAVRRRPIRMSRDLGRLSPYLEKRLAEIKAQYGAKLTCHPDYAPNPRHSTVPSIYIPARAAFLAQIASAAQRDRERNPAFHLAEHIRSIVGDQA